MEEILREILQELKRQTGQNERIMGLLERLRQPGQNATADVAGMIGILKTMIQKSKNPAMADLLNQAEEMMRKQGGEK